MPFEIDKKIPIPNISRPKRSKYPWAKLQVGDSVLVVTDDAVRAAYAFAKRHGVTFICRRDETGAARVWRIK